MKFQELALGAFFNPRWLDWPDLVLQKVPFHVGGSAIPANAIDVATGLHLLVDATNHVDSVDEPENMIVKWDGKRPDIVTEPLNLVRLGQGEPDGTE